MINARRDGFAEARTDIVIPDFLEQDDIRINRPQNIGGFLDALFLLRCRRLFYRAVRKPLKVPSRASDRLSSAVFRNQ